MNSGFGTPRSLGGSLSASRSGSGVGTPVEEVGFVSFVDFGRYAATRHLFT